jgi:hypothetical protein
MRLSRLRLGGFIGLCALAVTVATVYVVYTARRAGPAATTIPILAPAKSPPVQRAPASTAGSNAKRTPDDREHEPRREAAARPETAPRVTKPETSRASREARPAAPGETAYLVFRSTALGSTYGSLALAPLDALGGASTITTLHCVRVHMAAGAGVCLNTDPGGLPFPTYRAIVFDAELRPRHTFPRSGGVPSRARVSPDGHLAAITVFVNGHSYAAASFSTLTTVVDLESGDMLIDNIEKFTILRDGKPLREIDFNIWGVTFARDSRRFYATLRTGGRTYLIEGDVKTREARVLRENVECPSLSPDNTRLAFKKREDGGFGPVTWRLSVLELKTLEDWPLSEKRSVDDQVEWLDDRRVLYSLPEEGTAVTNTWVVPADGGGEPPRLFMPNAYSTVLLRK